jgi:hypothetical protein
MNTVNYHNRYGNLTLDLVTDFQSVRNFSFAMVPQDCVITIDQAEQIALITDNRRLQVCFCPDDLRKCYVIVHNSASTAALAKVSCLNFISTVNPASEIASLAQVFSII